MATVNWTQRAQYALEDLHDYLRREAPFYAGHILQQIVASVDRLEEHPLSGRKVPEAEREDIREVIFQHYRIIYWVVTDDRIDILSVIHGSRDLTRTHNQPWDAH